MLIYEIRLNGEDITDNISIGAITREKLAEPMDDGSIHLPLSFIDIEYEMKGLLEIVIEEGNLTREYEFLIVNDDIEEGSKYGEYKHDLTVMEYSGKYDDYIISSFASTKVLKDEGPAPFTYNSYNLNRPTAPDNNVFGFIQNLYLPPIKVDRIYYADEPIVIGVVEEAFQMLDVVSDLSATYKRTPVFLKAVKDGEDEQRVLLSDEPSNFILSKGEWTIQYGINNTVDYQYHAGSIEVPLNQDVAFYEYHIRVIDRKDISIYDLLQRISDMKSKFGGIESKIYYYETRLFEIDEDIVDYLKSVEAPQMYFQKMTVRQAVNTVFSYVNAISRFKRNNSGHIDKLSMDEFNKVTGIFDFEDDGVSNYSAQRSGSELSLKGVSFLERAMPNDLDEPTIETPANDMFKTVRATNIQMTQDSFELKLERPIYQPKKLEALVREVIISYQTTSNPSSKDTYSEEDMIIDLTNRWINIEKWRLKEITTDFPNVHFEYIFTTDVGLAKNRVENIYWQEGDTSIKMSDLFGQVWQSNLIVNVIKSAFMEHFTRYTLRPYLYNDGYDDLMATYYEVEFPTTVFGTAEPFYSRYLMLQGLLFNVEYISLEDIVVDFDRKDLTDNYKYYSEAKINQTDKLIATGHATRGMSGDIQRSGTRDIVISQYHNSLSELLKAGMYNPEHRLTIVEMKLNLQNEFIGATYMLSKDFNRARMFRSLMQEYRWSEIPTSRQIHDRHELYKDYLIVERPDKHEIVSEITKIRGGTAKIIFDILNNRDYINKTKITFAFVRTDGSSELYDTELVSSAIFSPVSSFGIKDGLSFSFGFDSNLIAGDSIKVVDTNQYYNNAIRYTDLDGRFTKLWFSLKQNRTNEFIDNPLLTEQTEFMNYPLLLVSPNNFENEVRGVIDSGSPNFNDSNSDYLIWNKDSRQNAKLSYQISILPEEHNLYVFGQPFFSNNYLVKNRLEDNGTPKYLYIYTNEEDYEFLKYGIFDDLKIKGGYDEENVIEIDLANSSIYYTEDKLKFRITNSDILSLIDEATHWAIGDENHNLYVACNENLYGFDVIAQHIRHDIKEIGGYIHKYKTIYKLETYLTANAEVIHDLILSASFNEETRIETEVSSQFIAKRDIITKLSAVEEISMELILSRSFNEQATIISSFESEIIGARTISTYLYAEGSAIHDLILSAKFNESIALNVELEKGTTKIKPAKPNPPTAYSITATTVTLNSITNGLYKIHGGEWQESEYFDGLEVNTQYLFYQKTAETETYLESDSSNGASITTVKGSQATPSAPTKLSSTHNSITVVGITNPTTGIAGEYRIGLTGTWQSSTTFTKDEYDNNLQPVTSYTIYQRYKETSNYNASAVSSGTSIATVKAPQSQPSAPTMASRTATSITLTTIAGMEYKRFGMIGELWYDSPVFTGLNANTQYSFAQRLKETPTQYASPQSVNANFYTLKYNNPYTPPTPSATNITHNSITISGCAYCEYSLDGLNWSGNTTFSGLSSSTSYTIYQRYYETSDTYASDYSSDSFTTSPTPPPPVTVAPSVNGIYAYLEGSVYRIYADITNNDNVTVTVYINGVSRGTISGYGSNELRFSSSMTNPHGESRTITVTAQASGKDMSSGTTATETVVLKL